MRILLVTLVLIVLSCSDDDFTTYTVKVTYTNGDTEIVVASTSFPKEYNKDVFYINNGDLILQHANSSNAIRGGVRNFTIIDKKSK